MYRVRITDFFSKVLPTFSKSERLERNLMSHPIMQPTTVFEKIVQYP